MCQNFVSESEACSDAGSLEKIKPSYGITLVEKKQKNRPLKVQQVQVSYLIMLLRAVMMGLELFGKITYKAKNQCSEPCGFYSTEKEHSRRLHQCTSLFLTITTLS